MQNTRKWSEGKNQLLAASAIQYVSLVDPLHEIFLQLKRRKITRYRFQMPDLSLWSELYQSDTKALGIMSSFFNSVPGASSAIQNISFNASSQTVIINADETTLPRAGTQDDLAILFENMLSETIANIEKQRDCDWSAVAKAACAHIQANDMEFSYFLQVWFPCIILYQALPRMLYNDALNGDIIALEKLLRLDRLLLHDPSIAKQLDAINAKCSNDYDKLVKSSIELPKPRITRRRIIDAVAGFISTSAILLGTELEEPQIRALFDAYANDLHGCDDDDIPLAPESFYQAIRRSRENWLQFVASLSLQNYLNSCQGTN